MHSDPSSRLPSRAPRIALGVLTGAAVFSLAGTILILLIPAVARLVGPVYPTLVKTPTWVFMATLPVLTILMYLDSLGLRRVAVLFAWGSAVGAAAELLGTTTGFPFGEYAYTSWLGPQMFGHVPWFIPPSWFALGLISFDLASRVSRSSWQRIALGALFLTLWDVSLDPAMSRAFPFWTYPNGGAFYGMPLSNWAGWLLTGAIIMMGFEWFIRGREVKSELAPAAYLVNCLFPIGLSLLYGLWGAGVAGLLATGIVLYPVVPTVTALWTSIRVRPA